MAKIRLGLQRAAPRENAAAAARARADMCPGHTIRAGRARQNKNKEKRQQAVNEIREMTINDYEQMYDLWSQIPGLVLSDADSKPSMEMYLHRNQGLSYVCETGDRIVGTVLCGHDGRRGFIYHVAVKPEFRKQNIASRLLANSLAQLKAEGIYKCHLFVIEDNDLGNQFWSAAGWTKRSGFFVYSKDI
jgi:ribosomal protein S18 acetylase RimI-like enzyme